MRRLENDSVAVPLCLGRPDYCALLNGARDGAGDKPLGVWTCGHPSMCAAVYSAVYKRRWGRGVELHELTFEL